MDAYVAGKKDRSGMNFGFTMLIKFKNIQILEAKINKMYSDGRRIYAKVARFKRISPSESLTQVTRVINKENVRGGKKNGVEEYVRTSMNRSFREVLNNMGGSQFKNEDKSKEEIIIPSKLQNISQDWLRNWLLGEHKDLDMLEKCFLIFQASGVADSAIKYLGGLNVCCILTVRW